MMTPENLLAVESHLRVLSEERTAELLGLHVQTLRRYRRAGIAPAHIKVGLHKYGYRVSDVAAWQEQRRAG